MPRDLHVIVQGMMVFARTAHLVEVCMLKTPTQDGHASEHAFYLLTEPDGASPIPLDGPYNLTVDCSTPSAAPPFDRNRIVIFDSTKFSLDPARVQASVAMPLPDQITPLRECRRAPNQPFFSGAHAPTDQPSELPLLHIFSYLGVDAIELIRLGRMVVPIASGGPVILALHAEEPHASTQTTAGNVHLRHVRSAVQFGGTDVDFHLVKAGDPPSAPPDQTINGFTISEGWLNSLAEKSKLPAGTPAGNNPCWAYVLGRP